MNVHIALIGYTKEPIQIGLWKYGDVSKLFVLHSPNSTDFAFENLAKELHHNLSEAGFDNIELREIDAFNLQKVVESIVCIYSENPNCRYFINITGGTKLTTAAACTAAVIIGANAYYVLDTRKIDSSTNPIIQLPFPQIAPLKSIQGNPLQFKILRILQERGGVTSNADIREALRLSGQKVGYHVNELERKGLILTRNGYTYQVEKKGEMITKTDSRMLTVELTNAGRFIVNIVIQAEPRRP